jgi:hypothetical protein
MEYIAITERDGDRTTIEFPDCPGCAQGRDGLRYVLSHRPFVPLSLFLFRHCVTSFFITSGTQPIIQSACAESPPGFERSMSLEMCHVELFTPFGTVQ